jgi:hypothetical protein
VLLGFNPRKHEGAQAWILHKRGWKDEAIPTAVSEIGRYGLGRPGWEKTANFVFFPLSFQKKLLTTIGDVVTAAPGRNFLVQEGLRRYYEHGGGERLREFTEKHLRFAEQLGKLNSLTTAT